MKAVGYRRNGSADVLVDLDIAAPVMGARDLLVAIKAVSVNPVDYKVREFEAPRAGEAKILGWDAAGVVVDVGPDVTLFRPGDEVFYAGAMHRPGTNSELHVVDERIVGPKPRSLSFEEAAALPLTSITAWEILFDRMRVDRAKEGTLLVVAAAGGVGSMLVQLARRLTRLTIVGTASRPDSADHARRMGAHHIIGHRRPFREGMRHLGLASADYVAALTTTPESLPWIVDVLRPQGHVTFIDNPEIGVMPFKPKSLTISWEMMFTRSFFETDDVVEQHRLLETVAELVDAGMVMTTATRSVGPLTAANLAAAHRHLESGRAIGKTVLGSIPQHDARA
jgi:zinc-binding alcohol dehydrogenase family protein